ncbi:cupin domain-containing protein [Sphingosinicella sp. LHD-64]|uniref:cupin domain-containing protein n=1 Tax=Sphingosinicella sp. LHD-64 TaxID=3072139 RepID=UPI00280D5CB5|nr:cupin domain-containing protein [Sphingosinicella sp. LHD-64]MDQ8757116.1 cupin domain-containing protein [Sphingosinicella sp. LHD-64]
MTDTRTAMLRTTSEIRREAADGCHDGQGRVDIGWAVERGESELGLQFVHDDMLPPGAGIGEHFHADSEEVYFLIEGAGTLLLDGAEHPFAAGDISLLKRGHSHGICNTGAGPMRLLVWQVKAAAP